MKKLLLGTTALVAAGFIAGEARAEAEPISLGISGYFNTSYVAILDEDDDAGEGGSGLQGDFINQDIEVHFKGSTELENGMTIGARVELEGQTLGDQIDENWAWITGSWGNLRIGAEDPAAYNLGAVIAPYGGNVFGAFTPYFNMTNAGSTTGFAAGSGYNTNYHALASSGDNYQLHYLTPDFNGFQLGISYAPDGSEDTTSPGVQGTAGAEDIWGFGGAYNGSFNDVAVSVGGGYLTSDTGGAGGTPNPDAFGGGLLLGFGQWSFGGSYSAFDGDTAATKEWNVWELGASFNNGPWTFNLNFSEGDYGINGDGLDNDTLNSYRLGAQYAIGPGIAWHGAIGYDDLGNDASGGAGPDYDSIAVGVGMSISY
ncbi:MAG: porin [Alphaproteobacteria bacterium]|nr:porin [Alphaproteobacteria bacterium]